MGSYISSSGNRLYTALEPQYGNAPAITATNRISAIQLTAHQAPVPARRRDKTGSRTFLGLPSGLRTDTSFQLKTYMSSWTGIGQPAYGPLFQAAMGATPRAVSGLQAASTVGVQMQTLAAHGLSVGSAVSFGGEIRFVQAVLDSTTIQLNAPFSTTVPNGAGLAPAITYSLAGSLPSVSIYDYWDPATAISRLIAGAGVNDFQLIVNGDFHEFMFSGPACDLLDSNTFSAGAAGLTGYPVEPAQSGFDYSIVPGHLGQVWLGNTPTQFFSLTAAAVKLSNNMQLRTEEYGASRPSGLVPGLRQVEVGFSLLAQDDAATEALYASAKTRVPISAMLQLGQQQGRLMGIYIPSVTPEIPAFNDAEVRLQWQFENCLANGVSDDELYVAFA